PGWKSLVKRNFAVITVGLLLLGGNLVFGFAKVTSWPFVCFPTFDSTVSSTSFRVRYEGYRNGVPANTDDEIKKRIEKSLPFYNVRPLEYKLMQAFRDK